MGSGLESVFTEYYVVDTNKEYTFTVSDFTDGDCVMKLASWKVDYGTSRLAAYSGGRFVRTPMGQTRI